MAQLVILRGLPGSGKSTYATKHFPSHRHVEADMFFIDSATGEYKFDPAGLHKAHKWCAAMCESELMRGGDVVVSNTFTQKWEAEQYADIARRACASVAVVELQTQFETIHGVPTDKIEAMKNRWDPADVFAEVFGGCALNYQVVA